MRKVPGRRKTRTFWDTLSDRKLQAVQFRELGLRVQGSGLENYIDRLYAELERVGLKFRPHYWLAEEWFSPDGVPGIAIPFYLAHPRLRRLERRYMHEVEGGNVNWLMRILRHEAGHALDSAFRLRRRQSWRDVFGSPSVPYPDSYRPRPGSRRYVQHLGAWYAQSHPTEDFAETFAVWLKPGANWRRTYRGWPALKKLEYVDELMRELRGRAPPVRRRNAVEPLSDERRTLGEHYRAKLERYAPQAADSTDRLISRVFSAQAGARAVKAATIMRSFKRPIRRQLAEELGVSEYLVHQVVRLVIQRCRALKLYAPKPLGRTRMKALNLVRRIALLHRQNAVGGRHRL